MSRYDYFQELAEGLYEALDAADEREPGLIDADRFLDKVSPERIAGIGIASLVDCRLFELRAIWNHRRRRPPPHRLTINRAQSFLADLDGQVLMQSEGSEAAFDILMAFEMPDDFHEAVPQAIEIAHEVFLRRSFEDQAALLIELALEGGQDRNLERAAGGAVRFFESKPASAHAAMERLRLIDRAIEMAHDWLRPIE